MSLGSRPQDNPINWSVAIGRLFGITIRLHLFFIIGALWILALAFKDAHEGAGLVSLADSLIIFAILFVIVLLHEFGHCWGARVTGGEAEEILLWPLGGLASVQPPHTPRAHFITTAAGPMVNVVFCIVTAALLTLRHGGIGAVPWNPFHTFMPLNQSVDLSDPLQKWLRVIFGLSYVVLLFNLLPVYPFDGGRLLHSLLWPRRGYGRATMTATFIGMVGAIMLGIFGLLADANLMIMIAIFGYITCYMDRRATQMAALDAGEFGYDFSQGYSSFEPGFDEPPGKPGFFERRRRARQEARRRRIREERERQRRRVDEILAKVHRHGMQSLTAAEARILRLETDRQRRSEE